MNSTKLVPHDYQETAILQILRDKRTLVKAGVGSGKTLVAVEAVLRAGTKVNLVIGPINTFTSWAKTFKRQGGTELRFIDSRKAGKLAHEALALGDPGNFFVGTERMRTQDWKGWDIDFCVLDESHRAANRKSSTFKMLMTIKSEYAVELSATPWANKTEGAWATARWLWPQKEIIDSSFWRWATTYLREESDPYTYKKFSGEKRPGEIWKSFPSAVLMPNAYNELASIHEVEVDLNPTQKKVYKELERDSITFLDNNPLVVELPSSKYIRLMETALATPSVETVWDEALGDYRDRVYFKDDAKSSKADAVLDIISDLHAAREEPVMIYTHSRKFAMFLTKRLQSKGHNARIFSGGMNQTERDWKKENFGKEFSIMVATLQAVSEGTEGLQEVCATEIWCSVSDSRIINEQGRGRISRQGQKRKVNRFVIRARDTIELTSQHPRLVVDAQILEASFENVKAVA